MKIDRIHSNDKEMQQDSNLYKTYIEIDKGLFGKEITSIDVPKDRNHRTYDSKRYIRRYRLPARLSCIIIETGLWITGTTFFISVFGKSLLNQASESWRFAVLLTFVLIIFPVFLSIYLLRKDPDIKWSLGLKLLSVILGVIIGVTND